MPAPLSNDLRKRIIEAKENGDSHTKIAKEKSVNISTVTRLIALYCETGSYEPREHSRGRKPSLTSEQHEAVKQRIVEQPDITLLELIDVLNLPITESGLCRIVNNKLGLQRKKNASRGRTRT